MCVCVIECVPLHPPSANVCVAFRSTVWSRALETERCTGGTARVVPFSRGGREFIPPYSPPPSLQVFYTVATTSHDWYGLVALDRDGYVVWGYGEPTVVCVFTHVGDDLAILAVPRDPSAVPPSCVGTMAKRYASDDDGSLFTETSRLERIHPTGRSVETYTESCSGADPLAYRALSHEMWPDDAAGGGLLTIESTIVEYHNCSSWGEDDDMARNVSVSSASADALNASTAFSTPCYNRSEAPIILGSPARYVKSDRVVRWEPTRGELVPVADLAAHFNPQAMHADSSVIITQVRAHTQSRARPRTLAHTTDLRYSLSHTHKHTCLLALALSRSLALSPSEILSLSHTQTHMLARSLALSLSRSIAL